VDWLLFPCSVLTLRFRSELGLAIQVIMGTTPMAIIDRIRTMAIIGLTIGTGGTAITATTVIITTIGTKIT
jgi:hypothetical protein